jgi:hypothetical protein
MAAHDGSKALSQPGHVAVLIWVHNLMRRQAMSLQHSSDDKIEVIRTKPGQSLGCSILDKDGREIPITEDMIQQACSELEKRLVKPAEQK